MLPLSKLVLELLGDDGGGATVGATDALVDVHPPMSHHDGAGGGGGSSAFLVSCVQVSVLCACV